VSWARTEVFDGHLDHGRRDVSRGRRKKILWTALIAGAGFLLVFGIGLHVQVGDFRNKCRAALLALPDRERDANGRLYTVDLLAVVMTTLTSVDTIAGEITSGTIYAIATKPLARWQILIGKLARFCGYGRRLCRHHVRGRPRGRVLDWRGNGAAPIRGGMLVFLECMIALSVTFLFGTWFSTLTNGVIVLGLLGLAFMGGWLEQMSGFTEGSGWPWWALSRA